MSTSPTAPAAPTDPALERPPSAPDRIPGRVDIAERPARAAGPAAAFLALILLLAIMAGLIVLAVANIDAADAGEPGAVARVVGGFVGVTLVVVLLVSSFVIVVPGQTSVRQFFGRYIGTVRRTGIALVPPLTTTPLLKSSATLPPGRLSCA